MAVLSLVLLAQLCCLLPLSGVVGSAEVPATETNPSTCAAIAPDGACRAGGLKEHLVEASGEAKVLLQVAAAHRHREGAWPRKPPSEPDGPLATESDLDSAIDVGDFKDRLKDEVRDISKCIFMVCVNTLLPDRDTKCQECIAAWARAWPIFETKVGPTGVPLGYVLSLIEIPITDALLMNGTDGMYTYNKVFCGSIDTAGCRKKENFPGPGTTSYLDQASIRSLGSQYPRKTWSGEIWRGHELGLLIQDPYIWSGLPTRTQPFGLSLGILPKQHVAVRPIMMEAFDVGKKGSAKYRNAENVISSMISDFIQQRKEAGSMSLKDDALVLKHQVLNKVAFGIDISWEEGQDFVKHQGIATGLGTFGVLIPDELTWLLKSIRDKQTYFIEKYIPVVERLYGKKLDQDACKPTKNCTLQVAASIVDALLFAGGLSVPTNIATGLGVLYSTHPSNPFPQRSFPRGKELNFFWENVRLFAPVVGFPSWNKRPTCPGLSEEETAALNKPKGKTEECPPTKPNFFTGFGEINQYQGGIRNAPNLALGQRDPKAWGSNSNEFVLRPLMTYIKNSVGFAEMAEDRWVQGGKNDRSCPGKSFALMMGSKFFELFKKEEWVAEKPEEIAFESGPTWVSGFKLVPAS